MGTGPGSKEAMIRAEIEVVTTGCCLNEKGKQNSRCYPEVYRENENALDSLKEVVSCGSNSLGNRYVFSLHKRDWASRHPELRPMKRDGGLLAHL